MSTTTQQELKAVQTSVQKIDQERVRLSSEAGIEEHKVKESVKKLKALGIDNAEELTIEQLGELRTKTQAALDASLAEVKTKIEQANTVLAEYNATVQG